MKAGYLLAVILAIVSLIMFTVYIQDDKIESTAVKPNEVLMEFETKGIEEANVTFSDSEVIIDFRKGVNK